MLAYRQIFVLYKESFTRFPGKSFVWKIFPSLHPLPPETEVLRSFLSVSDERNSARNRTIF